MPISAFRTTQWIVKLQNRYICLHIGVFQSISAESARFCSVIEMYAEMLDSIPQDPCGAPFRAENASLIWEGMTGMLRPVDDILGKGLKKT
ncbi:MAG: hypothetical protein LBU32_05785 [Clostridiales bacterium]|jgi:hypothetical protein|nr:hypothetical protein [Clostridiales bacterium]